MDRQNTTQIGASILRQPRNFFFPEAFKTPAPSINKKNSLKTQAPSKTPASNKKAPRNARKSESPVFAMWWREAQLLDLEIGFRGPAGRFFGGNDVELKLGPVPSWAMRKVVNQKCQFRVGWLVGGWLLLQWQYNNVFLATGVGQAFRSKEVAGTRTSSRYCRGGSLRELHPPAWLRCFRLVSL